MLKNFNHKSGKIFTVFDEVDYKMYRRSQKLLKIFDFFSHVL